MFICTFCVVGCTNALKPNMIIHSTRFKITAYVEYFFPMFFVKFFSPVFISHIPNINVSANVSKIELSPKNNPDITVMDVNDTAVFSFFAVIHCVNLLYHCVCMEMEVSLFFCVTRKYAGVHRAEKPNGMLKIIFHVGICKVRML